MREGAVHGVGGCNSYRVLACSKFTSIQDSFWMVAWAGPESGTMAVAGK